MDLRRKNILKKEPHLIPLIYSTLIDELVTNLYPLREELGTVFHHKRVYLFHTSTRSLHSLSLFLSLSPIGGFHLKAGTISQAKPNNTKTNIPNINAFPPIRKVKSTSTNPATNSLLS